MHTIIDILLKQFHQALSKSFPEIDRAPEPFVLEVAHATQEAFGHYQLNSAMKLSRLLKLPPRVIAETIVKSFLSVPHEEQLVEKLEIAGPGFINIFLKDSFVEERVNEMYCSHNLGIESPLKHKKVVIDFSSPNTAKEMHVGHLRSTIIGDCLARLLEFLGYDVLRLNHIGDWGTSFGMLIAFLKSEKPAIVAEEEKPTLLELESCYKAAKKRFDDDPQFKKSAQLEVVALQSGEQQALLIWKMICEISRKAYQEIYDHLGVRINERGESFYNNMLAESVTDLENKGLVTISNGAKCVFLEGFVNREGESLPLMIQKTDGGYNYDTTDIAAIRHRIFIEKAEWLIYVTDAGQAQHFQMIFQAAEKASYLDTEKIRVDHVAFGLVLGPDGKKFKTRSGDVEKLIDLIHKAISYAENLIIERTPSLDPLEANKLAYSLGIAAIKYADLSCNRTGDYTFSYERMLRFEGNTALFLLYAYVRIVGIKRKVGIDLISLQDQKIILSHPAELALALHLAQFSESLQLTVKDLLPNRLTDYLYLLAQKFNIFFRDCRVEGTNEQNSRLLLCELTARVLKQGLSILGIETVEQM